VRTIRKNLVAAALLWMACLSHSQQAKTVFDLSADFSLQKNPNRVWQYGYSAAQSLDPMDFRLDESKDEMVPVGFWHPASNQGPGPGYYPYIAYNRSKKTEYGSRNGWAARAGQIAMEASNTGQYSIVRFVVSGNGTYKISARFEGIHFGLSTTDVHVTHNGRSLFEADIDGYGGDPAFHKIEGASPTASYSGRVELKPHDTIDFAVGYGKNHTHFGDTTGLFAEVELVAADPEDH
jgi:hypothetical protein